MQGLTHAHSHCVFTPCAHCRVCSILHIQTHTCMCTGILLIGADGRIHGQKFTCVLERGAHTQDRVTSSLRTHPSPHSCLHIADISGEGPLSPKNIPGSVLQEAWFSLNEKDRIIACPRVSESYLLFSSMTDRPSWSKGELNRLCPSAVHPLNPF